MLEIKCTTPNLSTSPILQMFESQISHKRINLIHHIPYMGDKHGRVTEPLSTLSFWHLLAQYVYMVTHSVYLTTATVLPSSLLLLPIHQLQQKVKLSYCLPAVDLRSWSQCCCLLLCIQYSLAGRAWTNDTLHLRAHTPLPRFIQTSLASRVAPPPPSQTTTTWRCWAHTEIVELVDIDQ